MHTVMNFEAICDELGINQLNQSKISRFDNRDKGICLVERRKKPGSIPNASIAIGFSTSPRRFSPYALKSDQPSFERPWRDLDGSRFHPRYVCSSG